MGFLFTLSGGAGLFPVISAPSHQYRGEKKMSFCRTFLSKHQNNVHLLVLCISVAQTLLFSSSPFCFLWLLPGFAQFPREQSWASLAAPAWGGAEAREVLAAGLSLAVPGLAWAHFVTPLVQGHRMSQGLCLGVQMNCPRVSQGTRNASMGKCFSADHTPGLKYSSPGQIPQRGQQERDWGSAPVLR